MARTDIARRPERDKAWSLEIEDRVLDVISKTGSPKKAAELTGVAARTIQDHKQRDPEFGARYKQAMDAAFHAVLGRGFDRALDETNPSDRLIEALLKFRFVDRAPAFDPNSDEASTQGPMGLDPNVIVRMSAEDRATLAAALDRYTAYEQDLRAENALEIN